MAVQHLAYYQHEERMGTTTTKIKRRKANHLQPEQKTVFFIQHGSRARINNWATTSVQFRLNHTWARTSVQLRAQSHNWAMASVSASDFSQVLGGQRPEGHSPASTYPTTTTTTNNCSNSRRRSAWPQGRPPSEQPQQQQQQKTRL